MWFRKELLILLHLKGLTTPKHYGIDTQLIVDDFLYAREDLYQKYGTLTHITTNWTVDDLKHKREERLLDRFKIYNILDMQDASRRR